MQGITSHGFIAPQFDPNDYVFGGDTKLAGTILMPDGQWDAHIPEKELQMKNRVETSNCTVYGTLNCLETIIKFKGLEVSEDNSERYNGVIAGTTRAGNTPKKAVESMRKEGIIPEERLPFDESITTFEEYYSPRPMEAKYLVEGNRFLNKYMIGYEWVFTSGMLSEKLEKLTQALTLSPLGVSVVAWRERDGLYWKERGQADTHWTMLYGYEYGKYWKIFDSYDNTHKKLEWLYDFGFAMRYELTETVGRESSYCFLEKLFSFWR